MTRSKEFELGFSISVLENENKRLKCKIESSTEAYKTYKQMAENCLKEIENYEKTIECNEMSIKILKEKGNETLAQTDDSISA